MKRFSLSLNAGCTLATIVMLWVGGAMAADAPSGKDKAAATWQAKAPEPPATEQKLVVIGGKGSGAFMSKSKVTVSAEVPAGKFFDRWVVDGEAAKNINRPDRSSITFAMPSMDVTMKATLGNMAESKRIRVACVGDSITEFGWPKELQTLLGDDYDVRNFGMSSTTTLFQGPLPYYRQPVFQAAKDFQPHVVIVLLGTNDTRRGNGPASKGTYGFIADFVRNYTQIVTEFEELESKPKVYAGKPTPMYGEGNWGLNEENLQAGVIPGIEKVAHNLNLPTIDFHQALSNKPELFKDRVHPGGDGPKLIAATAYKALTGKDVPPPAKKSEAKATDKPKADKPKLPLAGVGQSEEAALNTASIFCDHMVLQQEKPVAVWGTSAPDAQVTVQFDGQTAQATADGSGKWKAHLAPMKAKSIKEQQPQVMKISDGKATQEISDVLIGEVWLGSGQSNMNREVSAAAAAAMQPIPGLRIMGEEKVGDAKKKETKLRWKSLDENPQEAAGFSTMMLPFARRLVSELNVPVGVIVGAVGGTDSGRWLAPGGGADPELLRVAAVYEKRYPEFQKQYEDDAAQLAKENADWEARLLPFLREHWAFLTKPDAKGVVNPDIKKFVASGGDINKIQKLSELSKEQRRFLDDGLTPLIKSTGSEAKEGLALVDDFVRATHPERLDLKPFWLSWHYGWGVRHPMPLDAANPAVPRKPGAQAGDLFANHIGPMVPYTIRGILWDQGESGTGIPGVDQFTLMAALIKSWRSQWKEELPWIYVQKPSGEGCRLVYDAKDESVPFQAQLPEFIPDPNWGLYREIHIRIGTLPKTYMVASSDLNPGVHPHDKDRYGGRAADVALNTVYGQPIQCFGPRYQSHKVEGNKMVITFSDSGQGLVAAHAENPQGFAIAGADKNFYWADAKIISSDTVELTCDKVKEPVAARYAYGCRIPWANLFNRDGLPAATFRTDTWIWEGQNPIFVWQMFFTQSRRMNWIWDPAPAGMARNALEEESRSPIGYR